MGLTPSVFAEGPELYESTNQDSELFSVTSHDNAVYDNGPPSGAGIEVERFVLADDFILDETTVITDFHFQTFEFEDDAWDGTLEYFFLEDDAGAPGNVIITGNAINVQKMNVAGTYYEYWADLETPIELDGGVSYWIGIHLAANYDEQPIDIFIERTDQIDGSLAHAAKDDLDWFVAANFDDIAFVLTGHSPDTVVGGEFLSIDTTALMLSGIQSSAIWVLPILAGTAGTAFAVLYLQIRRN